MLDFGFGISDLGFQDQNPKSQIQNPKWRPSFGSPLPSIKYLHAQQRLLQDPRRVEIRVGGRDSQGVQKAFQEVSSGRQQGTGRSGALQSSAGSVRRPAGPAETEAVRPVRPGFSRRGRAPGTAPPLGRWRPGW